MSTCSEPRRCSTRTWMPTRSGWNTPISWLGAPAGLVSGPRMLKMVRTPSSLRTGAACFIAGWWLGANMKPISVSARHCATCSALSMMLAPSASSTSALPEADEAARPPCLATRAPAAAAATIAAVEMLKVCEASPPVPHRSTRCVRSATCTGVANSRITWAAAVISPMVSFLTRRPTASAAIITGDISPPMMRRISVSISSWKISRCSIVRCSASVLLMVMCSPSLRLVEEVLQHRVTMLGQDGLGVELHALDRKALVAHPHDLAVLRARRDRQRLRQAGLFDGQRVIADHRELARQPGEHAALVGRDDAGLAVHLALGAHDLAAQRRADALVPQAHAEDGQLAGEML